MKHYALIPAKKKSVRCQRKNWRNFVQGRCLVDFTFKTIPSRIFEKIIISTDSVDYRVYEGAEKHIRSKKLASRKACVLDLINVIIREYKISNEDYIWLLNPTSPFRLASDYRQIMKIIKQELPISLISVKQIAPFIWKDNNPLFKIKGRRRNTDDFKEKYAVENGMFYIVRAGYLRKNKSWYAKRTILYKQNTIWSSVDIDTEDDFKQAQRMGRLWKTKSERRGYV